MVGERLAELRKDRGLSQKGLAAILELSTSTISSYEREINEPDDAIKIKIARYFNISLDYLLGVIDDELALDRGNMLTLPENFPEEERKTVGEFVDFILSKRTHKKQ